MRSSAMGAGAALCALALSTALAAPASASSVAATSPYYAGYSKTGVGSADTSGVFRVPDFECGAEDAGIALTVYAISEEGDFLAGADLFASCQSGEQVLDGHITTSGGQIPIWQELVPGDKIRMSITKRSEGPSTHDVTFESLTRDWASTLPTNSTVERIEIAHRRMSLDGVRIPPPAYKTKISRVKFDGVRLAKADATRTHLVDDEGARMIKATKAKGGKFRLVSKG